MRAGASVHLYLLVFSGLSAALFPLVKLVEIYMRYRFARHVYDQEIRSGRQPDPIEILEVVSGDSGDHIPRRIRDQMRQRSNGP